ncbi:MAG: hypothetical protein QXQ79_01510 [Candidatus Nanoarchaeia archaeon]
MAVTVKKGDLFVYYCFDVAYEIVLEKIETIFGKKPEQFAIKCERLMPEYVQYKVPPLLVRLGKRQIKIGKKKYVANLKAKLFDFGVVSLFFQIPFSGDLKDIAVLTYQLAKNKNLDKLAKDEVKILLKEIKQFLIKPQEKLEFWDNYIIVSAKSLEKNYTAKSLLETAKYDLAKIILCEKSRLSEQEIEDSLKHVLSYYEDEIAIINWQAAFIYDPRQSYDVLDVLEYSLALLVELRNFNFILDSALESAYSDITKPLKTYKVLYELTKVKLDVIEILDKLTDTLKLFGDLYLAKVFRAATSKFYISELRAAIDEKLKVIESIYTSLYERANNFLLIILEVMIVLLFIADIIIYFLPK